jgi:UDP-N-acetylmuramoyl-L-alanyl-D-glutamate--2,6-diaminopimelate ligase
VRAPAAVWPGAAPRPRARRWGSESLRDLATLLRSAGEHTVHGGRRPAVVTALADHTDRVVPGCLFACLRGTRDDGHRHADLAVRRGASVLLLERILPHLPVTQVQVPDARAALAAMAREWFGRPDQRLWLFGVTGTNGKTTTTYLLASVLRRSGRPCGILGTIAYHLGSRSEPAPLTTPGCLDFHRLLAEMVEAGLVCAAAEASSHALAQRRIQGAYFDTAVFTTFARDHLDFHGTPMQYFDAKCRLFEPRSPGGRHPNLAVINVDQPAGRLLARRAAAWRQVVTYGFSPDADVWGRVRSADPAGTLLEVRSAFGGGTLRISLPGLHNARNALAAAAACLANGIPFPTVREGIADLRHLPGRCERIDAGQPFDVVVDFAHNPEGLRMTLQTFRPPAPGRLIVVFGCKGEDGDRAKRLRMGRLAAHLADLAIIPTDDPYGEDPEGIAAVVAAGARAAGGTARVILDRREAVRAAIAEARPGDAVVVAGRGHEAYQPVGQRRIPLSDRDLCLEALRATSAAPAERHPLAVHL